MSSTSALDLDALVRYLCARMRESKNDSLMVYRSVCHDAGSMHSRRKHRRASNTQDSARNTRDGALTCQRRAYHRPPPPRLRGSHPRSSLPETPSRSPQSAARCAPARSRPTLLASFSTLLRAETGTSESMMPRPALITGEGFAVRHGPDEPGSTIRCVSTRQP
eukprot:1525049-Rhodomonas_salina.1